MNNIMAASVFCLALAVTGCAAVGERQALYHYRVGVANLEQRNSSAALRELLAARSLDPRRAATEHALGLAYYLAQRNDLAERSFRRALELEPGRSDTKTNLGVLCLESGRYQEAEQLLKQAADDLLYQDRELATVNLGLAQLGAGRCSEAASLLERLVESNPRQVQGRAALGRAYGDCGRTAAAVRELERAVRDEPGFVRAWYHLALQRAALGDAPGARVALERVYALAPESQLGREAADRLRRSGQ